MLTKLFIHSLSRRGKPPPLSRDEALSKVNPHAHQAKELAEPKGMKGYAKKADDILTKVGAQTA